MLLIEFLSTQFIVLLINKAKQPIIKIKFNLSLKKLFPPDLKLKMSEIIRQIDPNENAEGNKNNPA